MAKGIKNIKYNGWEDIIYKQIVYLRYYMQKVSVLFHGFHFAITYMGMAFYTLIIFAIILVYLKYTGDIDLASTYFLISMCTIVTYPLRLISNGLTMAMGAYLAFKRIDSVINYEPKKKQISDDEKIETGSVILKEVTASWIDEDAAKSFNPGDDQTKSLAFQNFSFNF